MKPLPGSLVVIPLATWLAACGSVTGVPGSGNAGREARQVATFSAVDVGGAVKADIVVAPTASVEVSGDDNLVSLVTTEVEDGKLRIGTTRQVSPKLDLIVRVSVPELTAVSLSGASDARLAGVRGDALALSVSGSGALTASGATRALTIDISGAGDLDARDLQAETAHVDVSGAGEVDVRATRLLDVAISGAGDVRYHGDPAEIRKDISGAGSLEKR